MQPSLATVKRLFAMSGNRCAFPDCHMPIVEPSGTVTGIICHIKAQSQGGPRYDPSQSEHDCHAFENLILLCARHSKVIDSEPNRYTPAMLQEWKAAHEKGRIPRLSPKDSEVAELLLKEYRTLAISAGGHVMLNSPGAVQSSTVVFKSEKKSVRIAPPPGCIASDLSKRNYIQHLINRYNDFARQQPDRKFRYQAVYGSIRQEFGAKWDLVPLERFQDLASFLQRKINGTMLGRINRASGSANYSEYSEFRVKYETPRQPSNT